MSAIEEEKALSASTARRSESQGVVVGLFDTPREEQRIVMFMDMIGSTGIAERFGSLRFHALLSDVFTRLSEVVMAFGGEVHRYVGDSLIATWPLGDGQENALAIQAALACREALQSAACELLRRHGCIPEFRASLHCGPLVAAAIGTFSGEIALVGDAMNTAARIEQACKEADRRLLVSRTLLVRSAMPSDAVALSIGTCALRGKSERLELFAIERRATSECRPAYFLRACA